MGYPGDIFWCPLLDSFQLTWSCTSLSFRQDVATKLDALSEKKHLNALHEHHVTSEGK